MKILDCETLDSTYESLEAILGLERREIITVLASIEPDTLSAACPEGYPAQWDYLSSLVQKTTRRRAAFDATCWFHCTRTWQHAFEEGLLPHSQVQDKVWEFLYGLVKDRVTLADWNQRQKEVRSCGLYHLRLKSGRCDDGPWGCLIRESAIEVCRSGMFVNYFDLPELVDNILRGVTLKGIDLEKEYKAQTQPTIVKFRTDCHQSQLLGTALFYAYSKHHDLGIGESCNRTDGGGGQPIPKEDIVKVEYLP